MIKVQTTNIIYDKLKYLLQSSRYEEPILDLMNMSKYIFPGNYVHIDSQAHGECDFEDMETHKKYDVKLLLDNSGGKSMMSNNGSITNIFEFYGEIMNQFWDSAYEFQCKNISDLHAYKIIKEKVEQTKKADIDEELIIFIPFPINSDLKSNFFNHIKGDLLFYITQELTKNKVIEDRALYAIYPSRDGNVVLRNLVDNQREFIRYEYFDDYFVYQIDGYTVVN